MDITSISNLSELSKYSMNSATAAKENRNATFENMFQAAKGIVDDANDLNNVAEEAEIAYTLGLDMNPHDLQIAQQKANLALQYTVAIRNNVLDAYKEIMSMQF